MTLAQNERRHGDSAQAEALHSPFSRCMTRSRKIVQFQHYCTDAPI
jgi:hypothetical protein